MAKLKGRLKTVGCFGIGFLTGAILVGGLIAVQYGRVFREQYYSDIADLTNTAYMIRAGREDDLAKNAEASIQQCVMAADSLWGDTEARLDTFWYVQRYYQQFNLNMPDDIKGILDGLPPDPRQVKFAASTLISVGDIAPDFTCTTLDGKTISVGNLQGKVVLINFFATWCGPCVIEMPYIQSNVFEKISNNDFIMIAIARDQQSDEVIEFRNTKGFTFPMAVDPDGSIFSLFATQYIPRMFVIGKDGKIKWESGGLSKLQFKDLVTLIQKELELSL